MQIYLLLAFLLLLTTKVEQLPMAVRERYKNESKQKSNGAIYTPTLMARALASEMLAAYAGNLPNEIAVLDPAVGEGELLVNFISIVRERNPDIRIRVVGYDIDGASCRKAEANLAGCKGNVEVEIRHLDFLDCVDGLDEKFDFVIANPPYIRTQILGTDKAKGMAAKYGLSGRIDIYYSFLVCTSRVLSSGGVAGYITSNKFFSIKSGAAVRQFMLENYRIFSLRDYGDTKVFENAAVLPCTIVFGLGKTEDFSSVRFASMYETQDTAGAKTCGSVFERLEDCGRFTVPDGRTFDFKHGTLKECGAGDVWSLSTAETESWLRTVEANARGRFQDLGKIKVGIKTTADNVFIGNDWGDESRPIELLHPLMTHRDAGKVMAGSNCNWQVLYPHEERDGKRATVNLDNYPNAKSYLEKHRGQLEGRKYVREAGRAWYEIWVPQNPAAWKHRKIVFRDISETPQFWFDNSGAIVNGDCYWIDIDSGVPDDMVYLALAVANSTFIEKYYDIRFNTKLYSGKRRFMTQYVEQFPLPASNSAPSKAAISIVRDVVKSRRPISDEDMGRLNTLVEQMFDQR